MNWSIDVVVPVFNRWELTQRCLALLGQQTVAHGVFVADNGSTDETPERLRDEFPAAHVVALGANLGFPAACNRGAEAASGDVVVLL